MIRFRTDCLFDNEPPEKFCHFGIVSVPLAAALAGGIESLGVAGGLAATAGSVGAGVLEGAGLGAITSGITGGNPLTGALTGGLTGGAIGGAGAAGFGTVGQAVAGAGAGAIGAELTGGNPLTGALTGGAAGAISGSGLLSGSSGGTGSAAVTSGAATGTAGGTGAASTAPAAIAAPTGGPASDLTATAAGVSAAPASNAGAPPSLASSTGGAAVPSDLTANLLGTQDFGGSVVSRSTAPLGPNVVDQITGGGGFGKVGSFLSNNPGLVLGAGALGANMLFGNQPSSGEKQLNQAAGEAASQARALTSYQMTGTLPAGLQAVVDRSQEQGIAKIKSQYAQLGMSGSTSEAQAVANAKQESAIQIAKIADDLATQGIRWEALSSQDLDNVVRAQQVRDQSFTSALTTFASGLAGAKFNTGGGSAG